MHDMYTMCLCTVIYYVAVYMLLTNRHMIVKELHTHIYIYIQIHVYMFIYVYNFIFLKYYESVHLPPGTDKVARVQEAACGSWCCPLALAFSCWGTSIYMCRRWALHVYCPNPRIMHVHKHVYIYICIHRPLWGTPACMWKGFVKRVRVYKVWHSELAEPYTKT